MPTALVTAWLVPAAVLLAAGVSKIDPAARRGQGDFLRSIGWTLPRWMLVLHSVAEVAVALGLVITTGVLHTSISAAALMLAVAYLVMIGAALRQPSTPSCACFGATEEPVDARALLRNLLLVGFTAVGVVGSAFGHTPLGLLGGGTIAWVVAAMATAVLLWAAWPRRTGQTSQAGRAGHTAPAAAEQPVPIDELDYQRTPIPMVALQTQDGHDTTLRDLARERPQLLFFVTSGCGACHPTADSVSGWRSELPQLDLRLVRGPADTGVADKWPHEQPWMLVDTHTEALRLLETGGTPSAVLLGADGLLAGGPVHGNADIGQFVAEIRAELQNS